ncbi:hypothetical protein B0H11DRAFT_1245340 [Mycena galericulata]|nr:hypothetical protein B0H11DRAFT_1245340 [Mycena galericulata]
MAAAGDSAKADQIAFHIYTKLFHLLHAARASDQGPPTGKTDKWFNLETPLPSPAYTPVAELDAYPASTSSTSTSSEEEGDPAVLPPTIYKNAIPLFRALYALLRILPAWRVVRRLSKGVARRAGVGATAISFGAGAGMGAAGMGMGTGEAGAGGKRGMRVVVRVRPEGEGEGDGGGVGVGGTTTGPGTSGFGTGQEPAPTLALGASPAPAARAPPLPTDTHVFEGVRVVGGKGSPH